MTLVLPSARLRRFTFLSVSPSVPCCICGHFISTNVYWIPKVQGVLEIQKDKTRPFSPLTSSV